MGSSVERDGADTTARPISREPAAVARDEALTLVRDEISALSLERDRLRTKAGRTIVDRRDPQPETLIGLLAMRGGVQDEINALRVEVLLGGGVRRVEAAHVSGMVVSPAVDAAQDPGGQRVIASWVVLVVVAVSAVLIIAGIDLIAHGG